MQQRAQALIDEVLEPLVAADGGVIELVSVDERCVTIRLTGMCLGCPGRPYTLRGVVEPAFKRWLGEDVTVVLAERE